VVVVARHVLSPLASRPDCASTPTTGFTFQIVCTQKRSYQQSSSCSFPSKNSNAIHIPSACCPSGFLIR
jgi:hypothetical protein